MRKENYFLEGGGGARASGLPSLDALAHGLNKREKGEGVILSPIWYSKKEKKETSCAITNAGMAYTDCPEPKRERKRGPSISP